jgi:hypothetical protein
VVEVPDVDVLAPPVEVVVTDPVPVVVEPSPVPFPSPDVVPVPPPIVVPEPRPLVVVPLFAFSSLVVLDPDAPSMSSGLFASFEHPAMINARTAIRHI